MSTRQTATPLDHIGLNVTNRSAREVARMVLDGYLTLDAPYQRGSVWTEDQRIGLIRSWLSGIPIPTILVNDRGTWRWQEQNDGEDVRASGYVYAAIDGKQRIETAIAWFGDDLAVPRSWFPAEDVEFSEDTEDGPYVRYTGLTGPAQRHMAFSAHLPLGEAKLSSIQAEAEVYLLVNGGGTPQTEADMSNAARVARAAIQNPEG
jgi:hypothetical protein